MKICEEALQFPCGAESLLGVLSLPASDVRVSDIALLIIVGGPQYRAGSHRQFVSLCRAAATAGFPTLRFDYRGMGDSTGTNSGFEHVTEDIKAAIAAVRVRLPGTRRIVLWGLCDGASAALLFCLQVHDPMVAGLCLLNPWARSANTLARTQVKHYYIHRLTQPAFWAKLFSGRVAGQALRDLVGNLKLAGAPTRCSKESGGRITYTQLMADAWRAFDGPILLVLSGKDYTAKEFLEHARSDPMWKGCLELRGVRLVDVREADHTFSNDICKRMVETMTIQWLNDQVVRQQPDSGTRTRLPKGHKT